jgi:hypothetical protein
MDLFRWVARETVERLGSYAETADTHATSLLAATSTKEKGRRSGPSVCSATSVEVAETLPAGPTAGGALQRVPYAG